MKTNVIVSCIAICCSFSADASIILNSNVGLVDGAPVAEYSLYAYATLETDTGEVGNAFIDRNSTAITHEGNVLGGTSVSYTLSAFGDQIGEGVSFDFGSSLDVGYTDFYLSVEAFGNSSNGKGWVLLNNSESGLSLRSSAMAYGGEILTVGTIPEPSTSALVTLAGVLIYFSRRKMRR